jgi:hypothetical protein
MSLTIIGFGKVTSKDLGETGQEQPCVWCSARVFYHLILVRTWLTYFFIRVLPYRSDYRLVCPACARFVIIRGAEIKAARRGQIKLHIDS